MIRKIIKINEEICNGCGACAAACHEGAIQMIDGKAKLTREDYCDGLGDCLPACPTNAITFEEREALAYDEAAVREALAYDEAAVREAQAQKHAQQEAKSASRKESPSCSCPGTQAKRLHSEAVKPQVSSPVIHSNLMQWPVQIKLVPIQAPYFDGANLLIAADCTAYAYGNFHQDFMRNHITLIGCPKLDAADYAGKLIEIIKSNNIKSVTVARMEVPCCGGIEYAVKKALQESGKFIPWRVVTITTDGRIID